VIHQAKALLTCTKDNCWSQSTTDTNDFDIALAGAIASSPPDCSTVACPGVCTCTESKCAKEVGDCLANPDCAGLQNCVSACKCGDHTCTIGCALKNPRALLQAKARFPAGLAVQVPQHPQAATASIAHLLNSCCQGACKQQERSRWDVENRQVRNFTT